MHFLFISIRLALSSTHPSLAIPTIGKFHNTLNESQDESISVVSKNLSDQNLKNCVIISQYEY